LKVAPSLGGLPDTVASLVRLHHARRWALRVLVLAIAAALLLGVPLLLVAPRAGIASLLLVPACWAAYLAADAALIQRWRARALRRWREGSLNLGMLADSIRTLPTLPRRSTEAVLATVPVLPALADRDLTPAQRAALATRRDAAWAKSNAAGLVPPTLLGLGSGVAAAALLWSIPPDARLLAMTVATLAAVPLAAAGVTRRCRRRAEAMLRTLPPAEKAGVTEAAAPGMPGSD
jgi:hypothetical protein